MLCTFNPSIQLLGLQNKDKASVNHNPCVSLVGQVSHLVVPPCSPLPCWRAPKGHGKGNETLLGACLLWWQLMQKPWRPLMCDDVPTMLWAVLCQG